jgi:hypothetical protein
MLVDISGIGRTPSPNTHATFSLLPRRRRLRNAPTKATNVVRRSLEQQGTSGDHHHHYCCAVLF